MRGKKGNAVLQRLYDATLELASHPRALAALALIAFAESSFFPIPPDVLLIPMVLAARPKAWSIALVCTAASVVGGFAGYGIGLFLFEAVGRPLVELYGYAEGFARFRDAYNEWGAWIVAGAGFTPFPYKIITIASGATGLDPWTFGLASILSRGGRFFLEAALLYWLGPPIRRLIENNLPVFSALFFLALLGGYLVVKFIL
jgi:membrane protein YqaA with SNARE-associated domain